MSLVPWRRHPSRAQNLAARAPAGVLFPGFLVKVLLPHWLWLSHMPISEPIIAAKGMRLADWLSPRSYVLPSREVHLRGRERGGRCGEIGNNLSTLGISPPLKMRSI